MELSPKPGLDFSLADLRDAEAQLIAEPNNSTTNGSLMPLLAKHRRDILLGSKPRPMIGALFVEGIAPDAYYPKLAEFLGTLACGDGWVAIGIARRVLNPAAGPYAKPVATKLLDPGCEGGRALPAETVAELRRLVAMAPAGAPASPAAAMP
jgi:hypothetical protein